MPVLSVILINFNRSHDTIECIESLERSSFRDFDIIVVDNDSQDGSADLLRSRFPRITLLVQKTNLGFAEGNNVGIREALSHGTSQILLLNNDTIVDPNALQVLSGFLAGSPSLGVAGPKIYYYDRPTTLWFAGGHVNADAASFGHYGLGEHDHGQYDVARQCDYVTGCCLLFRREVAERVGLLESAYFAYLEDADFCLRARQAGFQVMYQPKAVIYHKVSMTSAWDSPVYLYFSLRNKIILLRKHGSFTRTFPYFPQLVYYYVRQFIRLIFKWRDMAKTRAAWYGLVDGLLNRTGQHGEGRLAEIMPSGGRQ